MNTADQVLQIILAQLAMLKSVSNQMNYTSDPTDSAYHQGRVRALKDLSDLLTLLIPEE